MQRHRIRPFAQSNAIIGRAFRPVVKSAREQIGDTKEGWRRPVIDDFSVDMDKRACIICCSEESNSNPWVSNVSSVRVQDNLTFHDQELLSRMPGLIHLLYRVSACVQPIPLSFSFSA